MIHSYHCAQPITEQIVSLQSLAENKENVSILHNKRIVVGEDEGITRLQLRRILMQAGLRVVGMAANVQEGIATVLRERPDIVLMDISMPGELNGLDAAEQILATERICIIMLTAFSEAEYQQRAQQMGTCGYIEKPINRDVLVPQIETALRKFQAYHTQKQND